MRLSLSPQTLSAVFSVRVQWLNQSLLQPRTALFPLSSPKRFSEKQASFLPASFLRAAFPANPLCPLSFPCLSKQYFLSLLALLQRSSPSFQP